MCMFNMFKETAVKILTDKIKDQQQENIQFLCMDNLIRYRPAYANT